MLDMVTRQADKVFGDGNDHTLIGRMQSSKGSNRTEVIVMTYFRRTPDNQRVHDIRVFEVR